MLQERFNHLAVNWFDGMSIAKEHFVAQENHLKEMCTDAVGQQLNTYNYGLLPLPAGEVPEIGLEIDSRQVLQVKIQNLRAVTLCGARIEITSSTLPVLELSSKLSDLISDEGEERMFALVLTVNPYARVPFGNANPEENPPRKPYVLPQYSLDILPVGELGQTEIGLYHLTLGLLGYQNGEFRVIEDYIPPCTSMEGSEQLLAFYHKTHKSLMQLEQYVMRIVQKVKSKQQENTLAISISSVASEILFYLGQQLPSFALYLRQQPPVFTLEKIIVLARITHSSIERWQGSGKEEMLNYLSDWCDLNQGMLDKTLAELAQLKYQHHNTAAAVQKTERYLRIIVPLFKVLSELDYIGKKVDTNLFVTEESSGSEGRGRKSGVKGWFKK